MTLFNPSLWKPYIERFPLENAPLQFTGIREKFYALQAMLAIAHFGPQVAVFGWDYTNSVTRGEGTPGTAAKPNRVYFRTSGTITNQTEWLKADVTWTGANVTKMALYYSSDNEASYVPMLDEHGFYVCTIAYSGADVTTTTWGATP
jgi:hypothetical protein